MQLRTAIVGGQYHPGALERARKLKARERLVLMREPTNPHDKNAVAVMTEDGLKLGYVPRTDSPAVAKVLDSGHEPVVLVVVSGGTSITVNWES